MGLRTAEAYLDSLNDGREVYYDGERVDDIVNHPVLGMSARHFARVFTMQADPRYLDLATVEENGERMAAQKQAVWRSYDSFRAKNMAWRAAGIGE
jgi:aromatic ring hydroxylase